MLLAKIKTRLDKKRFYGTGVGIDEATVFRLKEMLGEEIVIHIGQPCNKFLGRIGMTGNGR